MAVRITGIVGLSNHFVMAAAAFVAEFRNPRATAKTGVRVP
jgi:hypothetical protein